MKTKKAELLRPLNKELWSAEDYANEITDWVMVHKMQHELIDDIILAKGMKASDYIKERTGRSVADSGMDSSDFDKVAALRFSDKEMRSLLDLSEWEMLAMRWADTFIAARRMNDLESQQYAARRLGDIIASQLMRGNFAAPRIVSEGLLRLQEGKPFKLKSGRTASECWGAVLLAFKLLKRQGIDKPSQIEVGTFLKTAGFIMGKDRLSKAFKRLKLKEDSGDARTAVTRDRRKS